jgi:hypothetical protein
VEFMIYFGAALIAFGIFFANFISLSTVQLVTKQASALTSDQVHTLEDPKVKAFVEDDVFRSDDWQAFTKVNGWAKDRQDRKDYALRIASEVFLPGMSDIARNTAESESAMPTEQELPVYMSVLAVANGACTAPGMTPAQALANVSSDKSAPSALMFTPLTPEQTLITDKAFTAATTAGIRHLCPEG